ncbi:MAG: amidohydrolase family protein [Gemmatimonadales bacterium]|nr:amidohydrolase family protein [Gemmatimonadales bacterium]
MPHRHFHAAIALGLCLLLACRSREPDGIALIGATLIDGTGGPPLEESVVVIRRGHVESVGSRGDFRLPERTTEMDLTGRWIMPGLVDGHVHLVDPLAGVARWSMTRYLAWGVTTVRDVHGPLRSVLAVRRQLNRGWSPGPRVYSAGSMLDGVPPTYPDAVAARTAKEARRGVDRLVNADVDLIKVYTRVDKTLLAAVLDEARTFNLAVAGHLGLTDAVTAARLGLGSLEHLSGIPEAAAADPAALYAAHRSSFFAGWTAFERAWAGLDSMSLARVAGVLAAQNVIVVPTLVLHETLSRLDDPAVLGDTMLKTIPEEEQRRWNVPDMIARAGWTRSDLAAFRRARTAQNLFLRVFNAKDGRVAVGTDAANQMLIPGHAVHREMELLVAAGLTPGEAITAATRNGALLLRVDSLGLIAPGKVADLVVLERDPLADIRNTTSIHRVVLGGRMLSPDSIRSRW